MRLKDHFYIYRGPGLDPPLQANVTIGFGKRDNAGEGEIRFRHVLKLSWNWLPTVYWWSSSEWLACDVIEATLWTGRDQELAGWTWPGYFRWFNAGD